MIRIVIAAAALTLFVAPVAMTKAPIDACVGVGQTPAPPTPALARVIGQYGSSRSILDVSEHCGRLFASGEGYQMTELKPVGPDRWWAPGHLTLVFEVHDDLSTAVEVGDQIFDRHDFGAEVEARIRAEIHADPDRVRKAALAATPPKEPAPKRASDLVPLQSLDPTIEVDTIYASARNFMGIPIYEKPGAYMQRPAAEAVARASKELHKYGYGLWVTDAYRPWYATKMFWDATPPEDHNFVADPSQGSRHNRGCAVDLTLYDLKTGKPVEMTGRIDEMSARSIADYNGGTSRQRWFRALLKRAMEAQGFTVYTDEWWHFDYKDWADYGIGTATYTDLDAGRAH